jgi:EmrB/QacA subfamily drug resistance transporter
MSATRLRLIALLAAGAMFMNILDGSVIVTALPAIGRDFGTSAVNMNLAVTLYIIVSAVFLPMSGWVADRFGPKRVFSVAIGVFVLSSIACALSSTFALFIVARVVQGIAAAMMQPVGRLVVLRLTPKHELMRAMSTMIWPALAAPIVGPPLGGYLTTFFGWPSIFYLNVPLGVAGIVAALILFPSDEAQTEPRPFDTLGFLLTGGGCLIALYGLSVIGQKSVSSWLSIGLIGCGLACLAAAVVHLRTYRHPLFDLEALSIRTFAFSVFAGWIFRMSIGSVPFLLPLMFQLAFGFSAAASGLLLLWLFVGNFAVMSVTTRVLRSFGFRNTLLWNGVLTSLSILACAALDPQTPAIVIAVVLFAGGAFRSMQFTALQTITFADVPQEQVNSANTLANTSMQLSMGMGIALGALVLRAVSAVNGHSSANPPLTDFHVAFVIVAIAVALGLIDVVRLPADAGHELSRHTAQRAG